MLVCVEDVAAVAIDEVSDGCDFALAVGTGDQENGRVFDCSLASVGRMPALLFQLFHDFSRCVSTTPTVNPVPDAAISPLWPRLVLIFAA